MTSPDSGRSHNSRRPLPHSGPNNTTPTKHRRNNSPAAGQQQYLYEVDGLRALALTLVVFFHLFGNGRVSGGVDIFLFISGFFATRTLSRRLRERAPGTLARFYSRTASRLIPAATVVLIAIIGMAWFFLPRGNFDSTLRSVAAASIYNENNHLIAQSADYDMAGQGVSPVQHFWSLSVQGQFFILWPVILLGLYAFARWARLPLRATAITVVASLTAASFIWANILSAQEQEVAYFQTYARFWQLGIGALLALLLAQWKPHFGTWTAWLAGLGLLMIFTTGMLINGREYFPGWQALYPLGGAMLVLIAAHNTRRTRMRSIMGSPFLNDMSKLSYALYLWHWPLLIVAWEFTTGGVIGKKMAVLLLLISIALSTLTYFFVEKPTMAWRLTWRPRTLIATGVATAVLLAGISTASALRVEDDQRQQLAQMEKDLEEELGLGKVPDSINQPEGLQHPGARARLYHEFDIDFTADPIPELGIASKDVTETTGTGCTQTSKKREGAGEVIVCEPEVYNPEGPIIVLAGGSHVAQYYEPFKLLAQEYGWRLIHVNKIACRLENPDLSTSDDEYCLEWNRQAVAEIAALEPDFVFTVGSLTSRKPEEAEFIPPAQISTWQELDELGIPVLAMRDNPRFNKSVPECLESAADPAECSLLRKDMFLETSPLVTDTSLPKSLRPLELTEYYCDDQTCQTIIGNVVVYRDKHHLTRTYALTLADALGEELKEAAPELFNTAESTEA